MVTSLRDAPCLNTVIKTFTVGALSKLKSQHQEDPNSTILTANKPALLRSLFTVGALCRHFDFDHEDFKGNSKVKITHIYSPNLTCIDCFTFI